jgi:invasion protein IalB
MGARAGLTALMLSIGIGLSANPVLAQEKKAPAGKTAPAAPAAKGAPAAGAPAAAAPAAAAGTTTTGDGKDQSAWVKLCEKAPSLAEPKKELNVCLTHHERLDGNTGMVLVSAAIRQVEGQDKEALMVMVPLGMALPPGVQVKVDDKEPVKLQFTLCHAAGCTAEGEATKAVIDQMKTGKQIVVAAINLAGKAIGFPVPLVGFDKAYAGPPIDNEKYKEARKKLMSAIRERQIQLAQKAKEEAASKQAGGAPAAQAPAAASATATPTPKKQ